MYINFIFCPRKTLSVQKQLFFSGFIIIIITRYNRSKLQILTIIKKKTFVEKISLDEIERVISISH